ncbi:hypothetical protein GLYMA_12G090250v4 [Glycine max]|nr:hypothetical protein GLYMA_12G090250v4 [Glycine max]KAH1142341.1 hypothetical protein GYH30_033151 [Glycine max]
MLAFLVVFIYISRGLCLMMAREAGEACSQGMPLNFTLLLFFLIFYDFSTICEKVLES